MTGPARQPLHATVVALRLIEGWRGVLIRGSSGVGKSDLALRLMHQGWRLVGDDRVEVFACDSALYAAPPAAIAGRMEVRGLGIIDPAFLPMSRVVLSLHLVHETLERMPEPAQDEVEGITLPRLFLDPRRASAPQVLTAAIRRLMTSSQGRDDGAL